MTPPEDQVLAKLTARLQRLNETVGELREAHSRQAAFTAPHDKVGAALGAINLTTQIQEAKIQALLDMVGMLAEEIDAVGHQPTS